MIEVDRKLSNDASFFLDFVRFLACQMVVLGHALIYVQPIATGTSLAFGQMVAGTGVILFFIISGALISWSLLRKLDDQRYRFSSYFIDRFARIYSGLLPCLVIVTIIDLALNAVHPGYYAHMSSGLSAPDAPLLVTNLFMLQGFDGTILGQIASFVGVTLPIISVGAYGFDLPLWSLAIEWWLYMLFGWVVFGAARRIQGRRFLLVLVFLLVISTGFFLTNTTLVVVWLAGVIITLSVSRPDLRQWTQTSKHARPLLLIILGTSLLGSVVRVVLAVSTNNVTIDPMLAIFLLTTMFSALILLDNRSPRQADGPISTVPQRLFVFGASYSYTTYLIHFPLLLLLDAAAPETDKAILLLAVLVLANLVAVPVAVLTERRHRVLASWMKRKLGLAPPADRA